MRHSAEKNDWNCLLDDAAFKSYSVLSVSPNASYVAVGSIEGTLAILATGRPKVFVIDLSWGKKKK